MIEYKQYAPLLGLFMLAILFVFLLSTPDDFTSRQMHFSTQLHSGTASDVRVNASLELGDDVQLQSFPYELSDFIGFDQSIGSLKETLGADSILFRGYTNEESSQLIFLLIVQSKSSLSFHSPRGCYQALGYEIEEESEEIIHVADPSWTPTHLINYEALPDWAKQELAVSPYGGYLPVNKIVVSKIEGVEIKERRVALYFYIKRWPSSDTIDMIRVSMVVPTSGEYEESLNVAREFMGYTVPLILEPYDGGDEQILILSILSWGVGGYFLIILLLSICLSLVAFPKLFKKK
ncbi:MAG: hypothetical protein HN929_08950 [Chloroflexi bacterium]|jgi:hypothetical protein|nr:hypothetical protein [Chloroflexota bacterium]MBT7081577.1 hypothetical protein [Chloroflexota bacterium]MBT7288969.1 hypothetical protein [Chloroflexota bacterium]